MDIERYANGSPMPPYNRQPETNPDYSKKQQDLMRAQQMLRVSGAGKLLGEVKRDFWKGGTVSSESGRIVRLDMRTISLVPPRQVLYFHFEKKKRHFVRLIEIASVVENQDNLIINAPPDYELRTAPHSISAIPRVYQPDNRTGQKFVRVSNIRVDNVSGVHRDISERLKLALDEIVRTTYGVYAGGPGFMTSHIKSFTPPYKKK